MEQIKFNHHYEKMPFIQNGDKTVLLEVFNTRKERLSWRFIDYDTKVRCKNNYYALPDGELLVLFLQTLHSYPGLPDAHTVWTTIRRHTPEKEVYYRSLRGHEVEIVVG